jgi:hypothetical protein
LGKGAYRSVNLWSVIGLALGILGPEERVDFGPDLIDVNLPDWAKEE